MVRAEGSEVHPHLQLYSEPGASLDCMRPCLNKIKLLSGKNSIYIYNFTADFGKPLVKIATLRWSLPLPNAEHGPLLSNCLHAKEAQR